MLFNCCWFLSLICILHKYPESWQSIMSKIYPTLFVPVKYPHQCITIKIFLSSNIFPPDCRLHLWCLSLGLHLSPPWRGIGIKTLERLPTKFSSKFSPVLIDQSLVICHFSGSNKTQLNCLSFLISFCRLAPAQATQCLFGCLASLLVATTTLSKCLSLKR